MTVNELIEMYDDGAITGYQVVMDSLQLLDPEQPDLVLSLLPAEVLGEMWDYAKRYDSSSMRSIAGPPPTEDQVRAAQRWIEEHRQKGSVANGKRQDYDSRSSTIAGGTK
jgi:TPP-dependent trihydroxycyclohexane-1,2-dione (THcHDO) dehydratase